MRRQVLVFDAQPNDDISVASSVTAHTNVSGNGRRCNQSPRGSQGPLILIVSVDVFNAQTPQLAIIPVPI